VLKELHLQQIQFLSEADLYEQAVQFMQGFEQANGRTLPPTQMSGLLDVSLTKTYPLLQQFVQDQYKECVWQSGNEYIGEFFKALDSELSHVRQHVKSIAHQSKDPLSSEDELELTLLLARAFMQHLLAENIYLQVKRRFHNSLSYLGQKPSQQRGTS
jgi:hypothetical protein